MLGSPSKPMPRIALVTPIWEDSNRFGVYGPKLARAIAASNLPIKWIVSDDGSSLIEQERLKKIVEDLSIIYPEVHLVLSRNRLRKGAAIYKGWNQVSSMDWLAFVDGDGAIKAQDLINFINNSISNKLDTCSISIRKSSYLTPVIRQFKRRISLRIFRLLVRMFTGLCLADTQCGAKIIPAIQYHKIRHKLRESGFIFDVELLINLTSSGCKIRSVPISWEEIPGGKVNLIYDSFGMICGLYRIRKRIKNGIY
ncbi:MAG: hypothetical protein CL815_05725 [Coraliomargarita sp.]|nr:hypothetical protein [Coraliomargarita sp.]